MRYDSLCCFATNNKQLLGGGNLPYLHAPPAPTDVVHLLQQHPHDAQHGREVAYAPHLTSPHDALNLTTLATTGIFFTLMAFFFSFVFGFSRRVYDVFDLTGRFFSFAEK